MIREELNLVPGETTKRGVLDLGIKCPHSCKFCYYSWHQLPGGKKPESQFQALRESDFIGFCEAKRRLGFMRSQGRLFVDITGGEPSIYPQITEVIRYAASIGLRPRLITLGQFLMTKKSNGRALIDDMIDNGLHDLLLSVHSIGEKFNELTGTPDGFNRLRELMDYLKRINFSFGVNSVLINRNIADLPAIAGLLVDYPVRVFNAINQNFYYEWKGERIASTAFDLSILKENLAKCIDLLTAHDIVCNVRYLPFCQLKGYEQHIINRPAVQLDPNEWLNFDVDAAFAQRENMRHLKVENTTEGVCSKCSMARVCGGINKRFASYYSFHDLAFYPGRIKKDTLYFRFSYRPGFTNKYYPEWEGKHGKNSLLRTATGYSLMNSQELKFLIKYYFYRAKPGNFIKHMYILVKYFRQDQSIWPYLLSGFRTFILDIFNIQSHSRVRLNDKECQA